jgi:hypothetical protein
VFILIFNLIISDFRGKKYLNNTYQIKYSYDLAGIFFNKLFNFLFKILEGKNILIHTKLSTLMIWENKYYSDYSIELTEYFCVNSMLVKIFMIRYFLLN